MGLNMDINELQPPLFSIAITWWNNYFAWQATKHLPSISLQNFWHNLKILIPQHKQVGILRPVNQYGYIRVNLNTKYYNYVWTDSAVTKNKIYFLNL